MKLDRKQFMNVCYHVCDFCADLSLKVTALFFDFLNHLCNCWMNLTKLNALGASTQCSLPRLCFSSRYVNWNTTLASDWLVNAIFRTAFSLYNDMLLFFCYFTSRSVIFQLYSDGTQTPSFRILTCIQILMPWAAIAVIYVSSPPCTGTLTREHVFNL